WSLCRQTPRASALGIAHTRHHREQILELVTPGHTPSPTRTRDTEITFGRPLNRASNSDKASRLVTSILKRMVAVLSSTSDRVFIDSTLARSVASSNVISRNSP